MVLIVTNFLFINQRHDILACLFETSSRVGSGEGKMPVDNFSLKRWRDLDASKVLDVLADYVKDDRDYRPVGSPTTRRVHVVADGFEWELLLKGPKWFDTRSQTGGGGAVDLVMYLWRASFKQAVQMLRDAAL